MKSPELPGVGETVHPEGPSPAEAENESLVGELSLLRQQLEAIQTQIADRENKLSVIDVKYAPMMVEVDSKLSANDMAKNKIVQSIEQVKSLKFWLIILKRHLSMYFSQL